MEVRVLPSSKQRAAHQLSKDLLLEGCTGPSVVVWGNGGFGPTSHGHASAPNKRLRRLLSKYVPVILSSEYRSSQRSACCHSHLTDRPSPKRVTVKQCTACKTLLSRDVSAACIILDIFEFQRLALARASASNKRVAGIHRLVGILMIYRSSPSLTVELMHDLGYKY
jgi:hypothetical protein